MTKKDELGPTQRKILALLRTKHVGLTTLDVSRELRLSPSSAKEALRRLKNRGLAIGTVEKDPDTYQVTKWSTVSSFQPVGSQVVAPSFEHRDSWASSQIRDDSIAASNDEEPPASA